MQDRLCEVKYNSKEFISSYINRHARIYTTTTLEIFLRFFTFCPNSIFSKFHYREIGNNVCQIGSMWVSLGVSFH